MINEKDILPETDEVKNLKLIIPLASYQKLMAYIDACDDEISGFADVEFNDEKYAFEVGEVYLVKQEVTGGSTDMDGEAIAEFSHQLVKMGLSQLPRLWWHSHAKMDTFWSSIDDEAMQNLKNDSYTIALEGNHAHKLICCLLLWKPFYLKIEELPVEIDLGIPVISKALTDEVKKKVKSRHFESKSLASEKPQYNWSPKKKTVHYNTLPKDKEEALKRILELNLREIWTEAVGWVFEDPVTGTRWFDLYDNFNDTKDIPYD